jgi:hypothetical protein
VLNDALHLIKNDPEFGKKIYHATNGVHRGKPIDITVSDFANAATVIETHHADEQKMIIVGGNTAHDLGYAAFWTVDLRTPEGVRKALAEVADRYGLRVVSKPKRRPRAKNSR